MKNYRTEVSTGDAPALVTDLFEAALRQPEIGPQGPVGLRTDELIAREALVEVACKFKEDEEITLTSEQWAKVKGYIDAARWPSTPVMGQTLVRLKKELAEV